LVYYEFLHGMIDAAPPAGSPREEPIGGNKRSPRCRHTRGCLEQSQRQEPSRDCGFAEIWIVSESKGTIQAYFIQQEAFDSTGSPGAPDEGARGRPVLIK
jgi:hypothetical protein